MANYTKELIQTDGLHFAMQYLLPVVANTTTITYGEVARRLEVDLKLGGRVFSTHIGGVAGALMDKIHEVDENAPLINALIVRQGNTIPSKGIDSYLRWWFNVVPDSKAPLPSTIKKDLVARAVKEVYAFPHWTRVYKKAFGKPASTVLPTNLPVGTEKDGKTRPRGGWGGEAESREHKALKAYVHRHPNIIGIKKPILVSTLEKRLLSYDEVDVFFLTETYSYLVEVKSVKSNQADFERGIYQCIKYRAVFSAQIKNTMPLLKVIPILVTEEDPGADIKAKAALHKIVLKQVMCNN